MKRKLLSLFVLVAMVATAFFFNFEVELAQAQGAKVGYPMQCTNHATNPTTANWITCTQALSGTGESTPSYTNIYYHNGVSWTKVSGSTAGIYTSKQETVTLSPTKTTTATVDATEDEIFAAYNVLGIPNWTLWVKNTGAAALTDVIVYMSPDGTNWQDATDFKITGESNCETAAAGATCIAFMAAGVGVHSVKMGATCATSTSTEAWITGNLD